MDKTYSPTDIEQRWYETWEARGYFAPSGQGTPYCIMIPPPNVTGSLHMGHAFQDTIMDALIRYHRMRGDDTLWQAGTDHAGIATQMVVERRLAANGVTRHDLGRDKFIDEIWTWKGESGGTITRQLRRMGASLDWSRERFTMDEGLSNAVKEVFVRLHDEGLIYRGKRLVNWDPVLHTAVSDLEVIKEEEDGSLWHLRYPAADGSGHVVVATTRPETMLGDSAVAVHPEDERYQHLIGKMLNLPLTGRQIPVIADDYVDREFGSGCVKITPAHDFNDYEVGKRHNLPMLNILTIDAKINDEAPAAYRGLDRYEARKRIVADLEQQGLLEKIEPHKLMAPRGDRSGVVIEPLLTDQWFVKAKPLAEPSIKAVEEGRIRFVPGNWDKTYYEWMNNIQDWCISRQIWWGHRIPAWYDDSGNVYVARDEAEVRSKYKLAADLVLKQDNDVLDTWFSSALWPFSTIGWPEKTPELKRYYPTAVLVTGFDIIFFWVARMIMMGLKFMDDVPFHEVYVHGLVRDGEGQKMSKSKGNVIDPLDIIDGIELEALVAKRTKDMMQPQLAQKIEKATRKQFPDGIKPHGTDALRFTFASLASNGRDIRFDLARVDGYRNFCNKLWNATRYVLMNTEEHDCAASANPNDMQLGIAERWIWSRLQQTVKDVTEAFDQYRFDFAAQSIYEFAWNEYCDWYLELSKPALQQNDNPAAQRGTRYTLLGALETLLRLTHPIMPFITEEIWQRVGPLAGKSGATIMQQPFPVVDPTLIDETAAHDLEWLKQFILGVRRIRGEMNINPGKLLPVLVQGGVAADYERLKTNQLFLQSLAKLEAIKTLTLNEVAPESAIALVGELKILVPMAGLIDKDAELTRLGKAKSQLDAEIAKAQKKLESPSFVDKAPEAVVIEERRRLADFSSQLQKVVEQIEKISAL